MSKEQARKERLFNLYAANLSACRPEYQNLFGCPLCLRLFERSAVVEEQVTLEHIVPSGKGAANETLTCKACNNTTGSRLDADLLKRIAFEEQLEQEGGPVRCEVITGEGRHNAHLYMKPGESPTIQIIGLPEQSNPRLLQKAVEEFPVVENFTLNWNAGYVHARSQTAMLRSAYLTMFRYYGYSYILHPALTKVREQIEQPFVKGPDGEEKLRHEVVLRGITTIPQSCPRTFVTLVTSPCEMRSFMVHLGLSARLPHSYAVVLPGPQEGAETIYERFKPDGRFDFSVLDYSPEIVYLASLAPSGRRTMRGRLEAVAHMIVGHRDIMQVRWEELRFEHLAALRARLEERGLAPASVNATLYALRGVGKACWNLGLLSAEDYARLKNVSSVRGSRLPAGRALLSGELLALLEACARDSSPAGTRDAALLCVLYSGGVRRAEVVALSVGDYEAETHSLKVRGKGNKERLVYLSSGAADAVGDWLDVRQGLGASSDSGPLFLALRKNGTLCKDANLSDQAIYNVLRKRARQAGVKDFSPHDLRRTFVGDLLERGIDIATVQHLAGHANVSTTARYDRRGEETKRKAVGVLHVPYKRIKTTGE